MHKNVPITSSAKKALRQSKKRQAENLIKKVAFKEAIKKFKKLASAKDLSDAAKMLPEVYQTLDKAAKTNVIAKNTAARLKSRMAAKLAVK